MLRFSCSELVVDRIDPLVNPGQAPSPHLHQLVGGNALNTTMDPSLDLPTQATCTTCTFTEDFSNYWTAVMYFKARNGTFKRVPTFANQYLEPANGGITVYYIPPYDNKSKVTAFKKGFRMIVGDPIRRKDEGDGDARSLSFRCWDKNFGGEAGAPGAGRDTKHFPAKPCPGGIRANHFFPTCWDGVNLDSPDHKSHVAYPSSAFESGGACPASHPVKIPQILYEVAWDTTAFNDPNDWPEDGSQPFVFSSGDGTGFGTHGDYVFGWQGDALQRAMDAFCNVNCPTLKTQTTQAGNRCVLKPKVEEDIDGWLTELPGGPSVTYS
ncbi:hypothetical protein BU24DRAFT_392646 [Aaosphaeria arxii CBS 175.79]|uniref:DUF1996 domain-containing protein n=1 Tax=Aaosphaeria arxii CBS 175.79 TaxID=1450172 RepID=A0A6A5XMQ4_9PLEO|nr:uncharacterized protein BU24DRAFT_392646 [Aaosphaeria arxii CBS 175.79]KAF2014535.1 hypothetical protein BU24DRAFT_392646 [Aaosphaeria arxii CBS 175.79]